MSMFCCNLGYLLSCEQAVHFGGVTRGARVLLHSPQIEELASRLGAYLKPELAGHAGHFKNEIGL